MKEKDTKDTKSLLRIPKFGKSIKAFPEAKKEEPQTAAAVEEPEKSEEKSEEIDDSSAKMRPKILKNEPKVKFDDGSSGEGSEEE